MAILIFLALSQDARKLVREGDALYAERAEAGAAEKAVELYKKALALDSSADEPYWKISRAMLWIASHSEKKIEMHKEGIEYAKLAVAANEESVPGHYWLGVHYGLYGQAVGIAQSLHMVDPIKKEMEWIIKKDEKYSSGGAHRTLGRLYHKLPGLWGGDNEKALKHLKRSIELQPLNHLSRLFLAELYKDLGRRDDAVKELKRMLEDEPDPEWVPETKELGE
jgi:tetratricopeptide (TPR) repeat protein